MDEIRFDVVPDVSDVGGFVVEVYVNDVEMTAAGAGLGMDPYDVLVPSNRFVATTDAHTIPVARCECGIYGCGATDVSITRDGELVHWDWEVEVPVDRRMTFDAAQYDAEVERIGADHSWETPERRAGRLVLISVDRAKLAEADLGISWAGTRWNESTTFEVALLYRQSHQVFLGFPWADLGADEMAAMVIGHLASTSPSEWTASWHGVTVEARAQAPSIAGPGWVRRQM